MDALERACYKEGCCMARHHDIFLIPGFFGFADIGELLYFSHVKEYLPRACEALGLQAAVHLVNTFPTASIRRRAARLAEQVAAEQTDGAALHLIGHSSGGLDARLMVTPGVSLPAAVDVDGLAGRTRSVVMVCTPNHGTPVASFFASLLGQKLLRLLSLGTIYVLRFGRLPSSVLIRLGAVLARVDELVGWRNNVLDQLYDQLLSDFSPARRRAVEHFLGDVGADQSLLPQLAPEGLDVLNATTADRPGCRYGSVICYARKPGLVSTLSVGADPYGQATHALFTGLYRLASRMPAEHVPQLSDSQLDALFSIYGIVPDRAANDGVVPTISQIWGEIVHATRADHLDVLGHFGQGGRKPAHVDWLSSGSGFKRAHFTALWDDVARFIGGARPRPAGAEGSGGSHLPHLFGR